jgi:regulatory protein
MGITEIKKNKNAPGYSISADGEFLFSLDGETILKEGIKKGMEISESEADALKFKSDYFKAKEKALRLLDRRAHSKAEIIRKVSENYPKEVAVKVAERLEEIGLINDESFARIYFKELSEVKKYGINRIKTEFYKRGIDKEIIELLMEEFYDDAPYKKVLAEIKRRQTDLSSEKEKRRAFNKFLRNGYSYDDIKTAFALLNEDFSDEEY